jgi:AcrR family transcriptional regulator
MPSNKSMSFSRQPVAPQRQNGKKRVAALLEAAKQVIAERGFEAATMAEIASRAGAPIGSLYRFFPNKDAVADALITDFRTIIDEAYRTLNAEAPCLSASELADALLDLMIDLRGQSKAIFAVTQGHTGWSARRGDFRADNHAHIARTLTMNHPDLDLSVSENIAVVVLQIMKLMASFAYDSNSGAGAGACEELRVMMRQYLAHRLPEQGGEAI